MSGMFARLCASFAISRFGDFLYNTALVVVVLQRTGSPRWVALAIAARILPFVLITPFAAVVADRVDRRRLMMASDAGRSLAMLAAAIAVGTRAPVWVLLVVATVASLLGTPFFAALTATVPDLVAPERLSKANAALSSVEQLAGVAGPVTAAGLLAAGHDGLCFAINSVTFVVSAAVLARVRVARPTPDAPAWVPGPQRPEPADEGSVLRGAAAGVTVVLSHRVLRRVALLRWAMAFSVGVQAVLLPLVSRDLAGTGEAGLGLLEACLGIGGALGAVLAVRLVRACPGRPVSLAGAAAVLGALAMAGQSTVGGPAATYPLLFAQGMATVALLVVSVTVLQQHAPRGHLARIDGLLAGLGLAAGIAGNAAGAWLHELVTLRPALALSAVLAAGAGLAVLGAAARPSAPASCAMTPILGVGRWPWARRWTVSWTGCGTAWRR